jgi:branched-chain amino acid transport system permease protein
VSAADQLAQFLAGGLLVGGVYALIGLGFVVVYGVTRVVNFAQGEFVMLGAFGAVTLAGQGVGLGPAAIVAVAAVAGIAALLERAAVRPLRQAPPLAALIVTIGASIALRGAALVAWGTDPFPLPPFSAGPPVQVLGATVVRQGLWVLGVAGATFTVLWLFFTRTPAGIAGRACALNARAARLVGVRVGRVTTLAWMLAGALGALAGVVIAPITYATYDMGLMLGLKGFVAAVLGGLTSAPGAIAGGLLLGVLESLAAGLVSSGYKDAVAFLVLIALCLAQVAGWTPWRLHEEG